MPKLTVEGAGAFAVPAGKRLVLALADEAGVGQLHACGGNARCTACRVEVRCDHDMTVRAISRLAGSGRKDVGPRPEELHGCRTEGAALTRTDGELQAERAVRVGEAELPRVNAESMLARSPCCYLPRNHREHVGPVRRWQVPCLQRLKDWHTPPALSGSRGRRRAGGVCPGGALFPRAVPGASGHDRLSLGDGAQPFIGCRMTGGKCGGHRAVETGGYKGTKSVCADWDGGM